MSPLEKLFISTPNLPSIPRVVQQLIMSLGDEDADVGSLVKEVRHDTSLSARVLRLANSSYYGVSHKVAAIDEAVTLIGFNALRTLVIASGVTGAFMQVDGIDLKQFWNHAIQVSALARKIAMKVRLNGEFAYTAGLMHEVGRLLIHMAYPDAGNSITRDCHNLSITERPAVERVYLQVDHCEVGAELCRRWNFPDIIQNALRWYANPLHESACPYAAVLNLAVLIVHGIETGLSPLEITDSLPEDVVAHLVLNPGDLTDEIESFMEVMHETSMFA